MKYMVSNSKMTARVVAPPFSWLQISRYLVQFEHFLPDIFLNMGYYFIRVV